MAFHGAVIGGCSIVVVAFAVAAGAAASIAGQAGRQRRRIEGRSDDDGATQRRADQRQHRADQRQHRSDTPREEAMRAAEDLAEDETLRDAERRR